MNRLREVAPLINSNSVIYIPDDSFELPFEPNIEYLLGTMTNNEDISFVKNTKQEIYLSKMINYIEDEFNSCKVKSGNIKSTKTIKDDIIDNFADAVAYKYCLEYDEENQTYFRIEPLNLSKNA